MRVAQPTRQRTYRVRHQEVESRLATFDARLEQLMELAGGVTKVAAACGHATAKFYSWTTGTKEPSARGLVELALSTGVDLNWLILGRGSPFPGKKRFRERTNSRTDGNSKEQPLHGQDDRSE